MASKARKKVVEKAIKTSSKDIKKMKYCKDCKFFYKRQVHEIAPISYLCEKYKDYIGYLMHCDDARRAEYKCGKDAKGFEQKAHEEIIMFEINKKEKQSWFKKLWRKSCWKK